VAIAEKIESEKMSEDFLKVLLYIFRHYFMTDVVQTEDRNLLLEELCRAGFKHKTSKAALDWVYGIKTTEAAIQVSDRLQTPDAIRIFCEAEQLKITPEARCLIVELERRGFINPLTRELVIDRAMALSSTPVFPAEIRCIVNMVLLRAQITDPNVLLLSQWLLNEQQTTH
jgi:Smg protein